MRSMGKSAVQVAGDTLVVGRRTFPAFGSRTSRQVFTQAQLLAPPVLRRFLRTDDRGLGALVAEWQELRKALGAQQRELILHVLTHNPMLLAATA
jgi:hypothetical protein